MPSKNPQISLHDRHAIAALLGAGPPAHPAPSVGGRGGACAPALRASRRD
jgi:hypothetical protein